MHDNTVQETCSGIGQHDLADVFHALPGYYCELLTRPVQRVDF